MNNKQWLSGLCALLISCGSGGSANNVANSNNAPDINATYQDEEVGQLVVSLTAPTELVHRQSLMFVRAATDDFTSDTPSDAAVSSAHAILNDTIGAHMAFIGACHQYVKDAAALGIVGEGLSPALETRRQPLLFAVAGVGLLAIAGYGYVSNMFNERAKPVADRIAASTDAEHARILELLDLPAQTTRQETLDYFNNDIGFWDRNDRVQAIELDFTTSNEADIRPFGAEVNDAMANTAVRAGEAAASLVASGNTAATGGQGYSQTIERLGGTSTFAAEAIDFSISAVSTATGQPLQPLDLLAAHVNTVTVSEKKREVLVPEARLPLSVPDARAVVDGGFREATVKEVDSAVATLIDDILDDLGNLADISDAGNGYRSVQVPQTLHITEFENPTNKTTFRQLDLGTVDMLVVAEGHRPQSYDDIRLEDGGSIDYYVDVEPSNNVTPNNTNNVAGDHIVVPMQPWNGLQIELTVEGGTLGTARTDGDEDTSLFIFDNGVLTGDRIVLTGTVSSFNAHSGDPEMQPNAEGILGLANGLGDDVQQEWDSGSTTGNWTKSFTAEIDTSGGPIAQFTIAVGFDGEDAPLKTVSVQANLFREGVQRN